MTLSSIKTYTCNHKYGEDHLNSHIIDIIDALVGVWMWVLIIHTKGLENKIQLNLVLCNLSHVSVTIIQQLFSKSGLFAHCKASSNTAFLFCRVIAHM